MTAAFDWRILGAILVGGGLGSILRYAVTVLVTQRLGPGFPWATMAINVAGSLAIGIIFELSQTRSFGVSPLVRIFLMTGVLGGFTTFSTFSLEAVLLAGEGAGGIALLYTLGSVLLGFGAAYAGIVITRLAL